MFAKRNLILAALGLVLVAGAATGASAETRWDANHPRQAEVLGRDAHQRLRIRQEYREGDLNRFQAHRLLARDRRIAREDRLFARTNGGYITRGEQRFMNRQENVTGRHIPG
jgi:hypothetical protein